MSYGHAESLIRVSNGRTEVQMSRDTNHVRIERYNGVRGLLGVALANKGELGGFEWCREWRRAVVRYMAYGPEMLGTPEYNKLRDFEPTQDQLIYTYEVLTRLYIRYTERL